jgi:hypothetical protein
MVAVEVAEMETTIQHLREQVRDLELTCRALEVENQMYQARCTVAEAAALDELVRSTQMRQTMTDMSAMLIAGLRKMEDNVDEARRVQAEREARRLEQERALEVGSGHLPLFMGQGPDAPVTAPSEPQLPPEAEPLGEISTSSQSLIPTNAFQPDLETDLERLTKLGEPDKVSNFR